MEGSAGHHEIDEGTSSAPAEAVDKLQSDGAKGNLKILSPLVATSKQQLQQQAVAGESREIKVQPSSSGPVQVISNEQKMMLQLQNTGSLHSIHMGQGCSLTLLNDRRTVSGNNVVLGHGRLDLHEKGVTKMLVAPGATTSGKKDKKSQDEAAKPADFVWLSPSIQMLTKTISSKGHVYYGKQHSKVTGNQDIAVKLIRHIERNEREARILTKLKSHPNVVSIIHADLFSTPIKYIFIAMELCDPQNLYDYVITNKQKGDSFDPLLMKRFAKQMGKGIKFIHQNNIVHGDLKLQNVLLSRDRKFIKIADFGLSKELRPGRSISMPSALGTLGYLSPETYNKGIISKSSDIFSFGICYYSLFSYGLHPYGSDSDAWVLNIKKNQDRNLSQILVPNADDARALIQSMLEFEPKKRPNASEALEHGFFTKSMTEKDEDDNSDGNSNSSTSFSPQNQDVTEQNIERATEAEEEIQFLSLQPEVTNPPLITEDRFQAQVEANNVVVFDRESNLLQAFNPATSEWNRMQEFNADMISYNFTAVVWENDIYVLLINKLVYSLRFSDPTSTWIRKEDMTERHGAWPPSAVLNGKIYVAGGTINSLRGTAEVYDPSSNKWKQLKSMNNERFDPCIVAAGGYIFCIGGWSRQGNLNSAERYDTELERWEDIAPMNKPRRDATAVELNGGIYVFESSEMEYYNPEDNIWTCVKISHTPYDQAKLIRAVIVEGKIFATGNYDMGLIVLNVDLEKEERDVVTTKDDVWVKTPATISVML